MKVEIAIRADGPAPRGGRIVRLIRVDDAGDIAETQRRAVTLAQAWGYTNVEPFIDSDDAPAPCRWCGRSDCTNRNSREACR